MPVERGDIHKVVHQCRIAKTRADDLQAFVKKPLRHSGVESGGEVRAGNIAVAHGVEDHVGQFVDPLAAVRLHAADADVDHIVAARPAPLLDLDKRAGDQLLRHLLRQKTRVYIVTVVGIEVLVHSAECLCVLALQDKRDMTEPHEV